MLRILLLPALATAILSGQSGQKPSHEENMRLLTEEAKKYEKCFATAGANWQKCQVHQKRMDEISRRDQDAYRKENEARIKANEASNRAEIQEFNERQTKLNEPGKQKDNCWVYGGKVSADCVKQGRKPTYPKKPSSSKKPEARP